MNKGLEKGLIQVYTGTGKGKTTAALGQGLRAAGRGFRVYMIQFLKNQFTGELQSTKLLEPNFNIFRFESPKGFFWTLKDEEKMLLKEEIREALAFANHAVTNNECDILILDEIMAVMKNGLVEEESIMSLLKNRPNNIEVILTGRDAPKWLIDEAHLVTEMNCIKHPLNCGMQAREGIED